MHGTGRNSNKGKPMKTLLSAAALLVLTGCATTQQAYLFVDTYPNHAYIYRNGVQLGMSPLRLPLPPKSVTPDANGLYIIDGITAQWASGATSSAKEVRFLAGSPISQGLNFARPEVEGLSIDQGFAMQIDSRQQQARQEENQQRAQRWAAIQQANAQNQRQSDEFYRNLQQSIQNNRPQTIQCTSNTMGQYTYTNCQK